MSSNLRDKLTDVPHRPGIYFWKDERGQILYVGRATDLRARLSQYFQKDIERRIAEMVSLAADIDFLETENVLEAVILEAANIKKYWPKYNIIDRDDRSFVYLAIPQTDFAKPIIIRGKDLARVATGRTKIFGPYQSYYLLRQALGIIRRIFPYSTCRANSGQPCFDYQVGLCPGTCLGKISAADYKRNLDNIALLLSGQKKRLFGRLAKSAPEQLKAWRQIQDVALLKREVDLRAARAQRLEGYDISHLGGRESYGSMVVFIGGQPAPDEYRLFKIKEAPAGDDERALAEILIRRFKHQEWPRPDMIMIDGGTPQISFLSRVLAENNISVSMVGISKFSGDKLVFSAKTKVAWRELVASLKPTLLQLREEAHRFANYGRRRGSRLKAREK